MSSLYLRPPTLVDPRRPLSWSPPLAALSTLPEELVVVESWLPEACCCFPEADAHLLAFPLPATSPRHQSHMSAPADAGAPSP